MTATAQALSIETTGFEERVQIHLHGDLDVSTAPLVLDHLQAIFATGISELVLDASELKFVDSTGLSLLLISHQRLAAQGKVLLLRGVGPQLAQLLRSAGLLDSFVQTDS